MKHRFINDIKPIKKFKEYRTKVNWIVFCLIVFVSVGGWIELFGTLIILFIIAKNQSGIDHNYKKRNLVRIKYNDQRTA
jgi:hypothetical protein